MQRKHYKIVGKAFPIIGFVHAGDIGQVLAIMLGMGEIHRYIEIKTEISFKNIQI